MPCTIYPNSKRSYPLLSVSPYPQISNLFRATATFKYQVNSICLIPKFKPFPPPTFITVFCTTALEITSACSVHTLPYSLSRRESFITLQSVPCRPPQLRCVIFYSIYLPHLHSIPSDSYWASVCLATLLDIPFLICDFCPSDLRFAYDFLQIHYGHPL